MNAAVDPARRARLFQIANRRERHAVRQLYEAAAASNSPNSLSSAAARSPQPREENQASSANTEGDHSLNWDAGGPSESIDWYAEYVSRCAPVRMNWLQPQRSSDAVTIEARGLGFLGNDQRGLHAVAPLDDGSLCLWSLGTGDAKGAHDKRLGAICARSRPGLLAIRRRCAPETVECVSVDHFQQKAFVAVGSTLQEVDLHTLQLTASAKYRSTITALSAADPGLPVTVGTRPGLYLHDSRLQTHTRTEDGAESRLDPSTAAFASLSPPPVSMTSIPLKSVVPIPAGPHSLLHLPRTDQGLGSPSSLGGDIYVAGRFPCILVYDRRYLQRSRSTVHSGARLTSLASLPPDCQGLGVSSRGPRHPRHDFVAAGEYNGKGSLEVYSLPGTRREALPNRNRTSAGRAALLSVAAHGTRLLAADGDGALRWFERDGFAPVRQWNINAPVRRPRAGGMSSRSGLEDGADSSQPEQSGVARKLLPIGNSPRSSVLIWTGERVGLLSFGHADTLTDWEAIENGSRNSSTQEHRYEEAMRRALKRQADEVRWVQGLGLGA